MNEATQTQKAKTAFDLAITSFEILLPVAWPGKEGKLVVTHRLSRPTPQQESEYKRKLVFQERHSGNQITEEHGGMSDGLTWLWDQIAESVSGYPGLEDGTAVTEPLAARMRVAHKEMAIAALYECGAEVLPEESSATFDGGEWAVRLRIGSLNSPWAVLKLRLREWTESEKRGFEKKATFSMSVQQGKTKLATSGINQQAFSDLFDALLLSVAPDTDSSTSEVLANGKTFAEAGREAFAAAFLGEWKSEAVTQLTQLWRKKAQD